MTELAQLSIDEKGCIRLPLTLQDRLGVEPGMTLILEEDERGEVVLKPQESHPMVVNKDGVLVVRAEPIVGLDQVVRRHRDARATSPGDWADL